MAAEFDIAGRWPELLATVSEADRISIADTFAISCHGCWTPNRDVENLTGPIRDAVDRGWLMRCVWEADRARLLAPAGAGNAGGAGRDHVAGRRIRGPCFRFR